MKLKLLNEYPQVPMAASDSHALVTILMMTEESAVEAVNSPSLAEEFLFKVFTKRLDYHGVKVDAKLILTMFAVCNIVSPGESSLWVHTLFHLRQKRGIDVYTASHLCEDFPSGFPDKSSMSIAWDAQKGGHNGNMVDDAEAYQVEA